MAKKQAVGRPQPLELTPVEALLQMKQELDEDIEYMGQSIQTLKVVMDKCFTSGDCLSKLGKEYDGKEVLVPLSGSVYVPGYLVGGGKATIGIGTGYFVERDVKDAGDIFKRKEKLVQDQIDKVQKAAQEKVRLRDAVTETVQEKMMTLMAAPKNAPGAPPQVN
ncbi:prefoldin subunit 5 [Galendromus occidentalis]|uniref:Prefoldin subunit 5 n=1 Tax=Galendromus occidentalis TaxID=34638 RepID=A0AAJ6VVD9_9ACAR|nr:prefoldin subunit 5 [Galendromus occidentalis]